MERAAQEPSGENGDMTIDLCAVDIEVPVPGGAVVRVNPNEHRADVVRRLLLLGVSEQLLSGLLPDWGDLIRRVARDLRDEAPREID